MAANTVSATTASQGSLGLNTTELRALEAARFRFQSLSNSIASFQNDLMMNRPLPNPCVPISSSPHGTCSLPSTLPS